MRTTNLARRGRYSDSGATLVIVAAGMAMLLGISALAIDLVSLYVVRNEAQRSADAAALAGASIFLSQGCTSGVGGCVAGGPQEAPATQHAIDVAAQSLVGGQAPSSSTVNVSFSYPTKEEPQITVTVYRDAAHSNAAPTFFAKVFGINTVNVSASATAEAFNPTGSSVDIGSSCIRPFFVPNCDSAHPVPIVSLEANTSCGGTGPGTGSQIDCVTGGPGTGCYPSYFFDPISGAVVNPGTCSWSWSSKTPPYAGTCASGSGAVGEFWALHTSGGPSQWYLIAFNDAQSGSNLRLYIQTCAPITVACSRPLNSLNGKKVGPTDQGVNALINALADGPDQGQDLMCSPPTNNPAAGGIDFGGPTCSSTNGAGGPPFLLTGGSNNPNPGLVNQTFFGPSTSIANVVVYDGVQLPPGGGLANVVGYMQGFIVDAQHTATDDEIDMVIMNLAGCGTNPSGPPVTGSGGSPIPIRLIRPTS